MFPLHWVNVSSLELKVMASFSVTASSRCFWFANQPNWRKYFFAWVINSLKVVFIFQPFEVLRLIKVLVVEVIVKHVLVNWFIGKQEQVGVSFALLKLICRFYQRSLVLVARIVSTDLWAFFTIERFWVHVSRPIDFAFKITFNETRGLPRNLLLLLLLLGVLQLRFDIFNDPFNIPFRRCSLRFRL